MVVVQAVFPEEEITFCILHACFAGIHSAIALVGLWSLVGSWPTESCCYCEVTSVMSDSVGPHRQQPTRLPRPWDSPGKNTGVGCHFLLQCMKVNSEREVVQLCPTPCDLMDCSPPGSTVHEIFQARVLEWGAIAFSTTESCPLQ